MFFLIFTPWPSTKILADPGLEPALVEPISFTFSALTTMPFVLGSDDCPEPTITVSSEIEPIYGDTVSNGCQVPNLHPMPHWQVVLGAIAIGILLSPKRDFHFVFKGNSPFIKHLLLCEKSHSGEALSPRKSTV